MYLKRKKLCIACMEGAPAVNQDKLLEFIENSSWQLDNQAIPKIFRKFTFANFQRTMDFVKAIAEIAEYEGHHPKLVVEVRSVEVVWWTTKIANIHQNDLICAQLTDDLFEHLKTKHS